MISGLIVFLFCVVDITTRCYCFLPYSLYHLLVLLINLAVLALYLQTALTWEQELFIGKYR